MLRVLLAITFIADILNVSGFEILDTTNINAFVWAAVWLTDKYIN